jgi:hypothetical protein
MRSAFRTFTSLLGVCAACYLLASASWQQVLLLFLAASIGWCLFAFTFDDTDDLLVSERAPNMKARSQRVRKAKTMVPAAVAIPMAQPAERIQMSYRFPMHKLSRPSFTDC